MLLPLQGATTPTRDTQGVATLALGYGLHLHIHFYYTVISNETVHWL
mgnify:CR=1 FL=1